MRGYGVKRQNISHTFKKITNVFIHLSTQNLLSIVMVLLVLYQCYYAAMSTYIGWDTTYYIGTINSSLYLDTMYLYNGASGAKEGYLPIRYALSTFYMNSAVWCKWFGIEAIPMQRYIVTIIGQLMYHAFAYLIARSIWRNDRKKINIFIIANVLCTFLFVDNHTTAGFLLNRGYEAKAFCANVLILATIYCVLELRKNSNDFSKWRNMFIVLATSIPISMSALLTIPVLVIALLAMLFYHTNNINVIKRGIVCLIPNILYLLFYFLYAKGIFLIPV